MPGNIFPYHSRVSKCYWHLLGRCQEAAIYPHGTGQHPPGELLPSSNAIVAQGEKPCSSVYPSVLIQCLCLRNTLHTRLAMDQWREGASWVWDRHPTPPPPCPPVWAEPTSGKMGRAPPGGASSGLTLARWGQVTKWHEQVVLRLLLQQCHWTGLGEKHLTQQKMILGMIQNREIFHPNFIDARSGLGWHLESSIIKTVLN